jgi:sugar lactone lactonase YvrE
MLVTVVCGQTPDYPYVFKQFAGAFPLGDGGAAVQALLYNPVATQLDSAGNVYILDQSNFRIRKVATNGTISTFAEIKVDGVPLAASDMKRGPDGSFYVSTPGRILKISSAGVVGTLAGSATTGTSPDGTSASQANLSQRLSGIALDSAGLVYFAEDSRVRRIKADGTLETVAGTATAGFDGDNKPATSARLNYPVGIVLDASNNLYIADYLNYRIRKVAGGTITTIAGNGTLGVPAAGSAAASALGTPTGLTLDSAGNLLAVDSAYFLVLKISGGNLSLLAGSGTFSYSDGPALGTYLYGPVGITADSSGNLYVAEKTSHRVRKIAGSTTSTIAGRLHFAGDGGPATSAILNQPIDVALDPQGIAAIVDSENFRVRRVAANGVINTIAGTGLPALPVNGAQAAGSSVPKMSAATYDSQGNLYLATTDPSLFGSRILRIDAAGAITRFAGNGTYASSGNGGLATAASFQYITGLAADLTGNLYVGDSLAHVVRRISPAGIVTAFAGTGAAGFSGDSGPASAAALNLTGGVPLPVDRAGNVFIGDGGNNRVRRVDTSGAITTYAGNGTAGLCTDGAQAGASPLYAAAGLTADTSGNLYIAPRAGGVWWRVNPAGAGHRHRQ